MKTIEQTTQSIYNSRRTEDNAETIARWEGNNGSVEGGLYGKIRPLKKTQFSPNVADAEDVRQLIREYIAPTDGHRREVKNSSYVIFSVNQNGCQSFMVTDDKTLYNSCPYSELTYDELESGLQKAKDAGL